MSHVVPLHHQAFDMNDFYQELSRIPNIIICVQYNENVILSFRLCNVSQAEVIYEGAKAIGLLCQIDGKSYTLNCEHLRQLSKRECRELFNYLGIDGSQLLQD